MIDWNWQRWWVKNEVQSILWSVSFVQANQLVNCRKIRLHIKTITNSYCKLPPVISLTIRIGVSIIFGVFHWSPPRKCNEKQFKMFYFGLMVNTHIHKRTGQKQFSFKLNGIPNRFIQSVNKETHRKKQHFSIKLKVLIYCFYLSFLFDFFHLSLSIYFYDLNS